MRILPLAALAAVAALLSASPASAADDINALRRAFTQPAADARPWCYWYWMNGNVTRDGVIADLRAMHDVGVGGVFLMDIGIHPAGPVINRSREWYDLVKVAVAEALRLDIKVSFHCPGWSASGGPWITPDLAMQELTWSEAHIDGGAERAIALPRPPAKLGFYRDIAVLAFPSLDGDDWSMCDQKPVIRDTDGKPIPNADRSFDHDNNTAASLPQTFDLLFDHPIAARSLYVRAARDNGDFHASLEAYDDSHSAFVPVAQCRSFTSGPFSSQIGDVTFRPVKSARFRLHFPGRRPDARAIIEELDLRGSYRVPEWTAKAGFATDRILPQRNAVAPLPGDAIPLDRIIDLTDKLTADGKLTWQAPPGRWTILRIGHTPTGVHISPAPAGGDGLECDKMSRDAADFHYDHFITPLLKQLGPDLAKALAYQHVDSYEAGWQNWTSSFPDEFRHRRGYDLRKYLPAVTGRVVADLPATEAFLWDFRRTIGDLYADNHYGRLAQRSHQDHLGFSTEPYGGPFEFVQCGTRADSPMAEFWLPGRPEGKKPAFVGVFAGHVAGRQIIGSEAFTSGPPEEKWNSHPWSLKTLGDFIWTAGINRFVIHVSAQQPFIGEHLRPGLTCGFNGIHFDRNNTWWSQGRAWVQYLTRSQSLLQQGQPVADALYYQGDDSPCATAPFQPELPDGYDFDACGSETLSALTVKNGLLTLPHGVTYRYLVLPPDGRMGVASIAKIVELTKSGATVIGPRKFESPSLADTADASKMQSLSRDLWAGASPRAICGRSFAQILADDNLPPDFTFDKEAAISLHATHRKVGDADVYFVANASPRAATVNCAFRVTGKTPELWRPDTGEMVLAGVYQPLPRVTRVPIWFDPGGSVFVIFAPGQPPQPLITDLTYTADSAESPAANLQILEASYGPPDDPTRTIDVTRQLAARIRDRKLFIEGFTALKGDPAPGVRKRLRVRYQWAAKELSATADDGDALALPVIDRTLPGQILRRADRPVLRARQGGRFTLRFATGVQRTIPVPPLPSPLPVAGPWELSFPPGWGAPPSVQLPTLLSWPDHPDAGVRHFSGTALYRANIEIPADRFGPGQSLQLDLGDVQVIAEVKLNGHDLGILWKPPFAVDITSAAKPGENTLEVRVTNLWPNRLIGDEQYPDDCSPNGKWLEGGIHSWPAWVLNNQPRPEPRRLTFTALKHWKKDDPLLPSGLLGPVKIITSREIAVEEIP